MVCDQCKGSGKTVCYNCEGKGYFMDITDYRYYACLKCGGAGSSSYPSIQAIYRAENKGEVKLGSGWIKCNKCNGTGLLGNDLEFLLSLIRKLMSNEKLSENELLLL
ncbi:MAG TPA: hypothetical protein VKU94_01235, partial [Geobacterales bacterium]|nr:hypothetical protein [Geobacterales bacterium]